MSIGLFVDGSFVYKTYPDAIDYLKLREVIEEDTGDKIDEAYFFNADDDPPKATKYNNHLTFPPPRGPGFRGRSFTGHLILEASPFFILMIHQFSSSLFSRKVLMWGLPFISCGHSIRDIGRS